MDAIRQKLHSQRGASMLMALLLFLVAVMVSVVMLTAAISAALSVRSDRQQQQTYLTVSSAAELLRDGLASGSGGYQQIVTTRYQDSAKKVPLRQTVTSQPGSGPFSVVLDEALEKLLADPQYVYSKTVSVSGDGMEPVSAQLLLSWNTTVSTYRLTVCFTGGEDPHSCRMYLTADGYLAQEVSDTEVGTNYQEVVTTQMEWRNLTITRKEADQT